MPTVTIFAPRAGDTVSTTDVKVYVPFAGFTPAAKVICSGPSLPDKDADLNGSGMYAYSFGNVAAGTRNVSVKYDGMEQAKEEGVIFSNDPPVITSQLTGPRRGKNKYKIEVNVKDLGASQVVVLVSEVNTKTGATVLKAVGVDTVNGNNKKALVKVEMEFQGDGFVYFARAFLFDGQMNQIASTSQQLTKPNG